MGQAIGGILPLALGVVIGVLPVIAIILILITPRARSNGGAFVAGWVLGLVVVGGVVLVVANAAGVSSSSGPSTAAYAIKLALGVLFLLLAAFQVATFRAEGDYQDGRHPERVAFGDAEADARRRDFTGNGLFYDPARKGLHDWG